jgi:hypothetical protein
VNTPRLFRRDAEAAPRRATSELRTPLLIAAGLIGVPLAMGLANYLSGDDEAEPAQVASSPPPSVDPNTSYPMNHFLPGAGYYHAPWHAWFPMPFNTYQAGRGWFRGGQWRTTPDEDEAERREQQRTSGFTATSSTGGRIINSRPSPAAVQRANTGAAAQHSANITRGGFGASARPGAS